MNRRLERSREKCANSVDVLPLAFLLVCVIFAETLGCSSVVSAGQDSSASLALYLGRYVALLSEGDSLSPTFFSTFCDFFLFPVFVFLAGISSLGIFIVPLVLSFRVFLLSYAISSFFHVFGISALSVALTVFGLEALVMVPVLLTLGTHAFANSIRLTQGTFRGLGYKIQLFDYTLLAAACCTFLLFALFLQWSVVPQLQVAAAKIIMIS